MKKPTEAELEILSVLWQKGPSTVRVVHKELAKRKDVFYTTTLKTMQVMTDKGLLNRDTSRRSHIYTAALKKRQAAKSMIERLTNNVFAGSTTQLVLSVLGNAKPSKKELEEIKELIYKIENDGNSK